MLGVRLAVLALRTEPRPEDGNHDVGLRDLQDLVADPLPAFEMEASIGVRLPPLDVENEVPVAPLPARSLVEHTLDGVALVGDIPRRNDDHPKRSVLIPWRAAPPAYHASLSVSAWIDARSLDGFAQALAGRPQIGFSLREPPR